MIAMAVILIGLAGVTSALWFGISSSQHGNRIAEATNHARSMLEAMQGRNYLDLVIPAQMVGGWPGPLSGLNDNPTDRKLLDDPPFLNAHLPDSNLSYYRRNVVSERLNTDSSNHEYHLARVTIRIFWSEKGVEKNVAITGIVRHSL